MKAQRKEYSVQAVLNLGINSPRHSVQCGNGQVWRASGIRAAYSKLEVLTDSLPSVPGSSVLIPIIVAVIGVLGALIPAIYVNSLQTQPEPDITLCSCIHRMYTLFELY